MPSLFWMLLAAARSGPRPYRIIMHLLAELRAVCRAEAAEGVKGYGRSVSTLQAVGTAYAADMGIQAHGSAETVGQALAVAEAPLSVVLGLTGNSAVGFALAQAADAAEGFGQSVTELLTVAAPASMGQVFGYGQAVYIIEGYLLSDAAEIQDATGLVRVCLIGSVYPDTDAGYPVGMTAVGEGIGALSFDTWDTTVTVLMPATAHLEANCAAETRKLCIVTFIVAGVTEHEERVLEGESCSDPLEDGTIPPVIKSATVSHTFKHVGWSRTEDGPIETKEAILEERIIYGFAPLEGYDLYCYQMLPHFQLVAGETYQVLWGEGTYLCKGIDVGAIFSGGVAIGNGSAYGFPGNGEPFMIIATPDAIVFYAFDDDVSHNVGISPCDVLTNISDDLKLYPAFEATLRSYTARFWLDGELQESQLVEYGSHATPPNLTKEGYVLQWAPSDMTITGDTDFYGTWTRDYILPLQDTEFSYRENAGSYCNKKAVTVLREIVVGKSYVIEWDGMEHVCEAKKMPFTYKVNGNTISTSLSCTLGNTAHIKKYYSYDITTGLPATDEPFFMYYDTYGMNLTIYASNTDTTHMVGIYEIQV